MAGFPIKDTRKRDARATASRNKTKGPRVMMRKLPSQVRGTSNLHRSLLILSKPNEHYVANSYTVARSAQRKQKRKSDQKLETRTRKKRPPTGMDGVANKRTATGCSSEATIGEEGGDRFHEKKVKWCCRRFSTLAVRLHSRQNGIKQAQ